VSPKSQPSDYPLILKRLYIEVTLKAGNSQVKGLLQGKKSKKPKTRKCGF
jgi:hypothetical protein